MKKERNPCDLCGQPVKVAGFNFQTLAGNKKFCCEGCLSIFQLLNPEHISTQPSTEKIS